MAIRVQKKQIFVDVIKKVKHNAFMPRLIFLGTGTSTGVPQVGCTCPVCTSADPHDKRLRTSAIIISDNGRRLLIDCGPDFRQQMLSIPFGPIDKVLLTHEHYDHVGGIDDLRPFSFPTAVDVYADAWCCADVKARIPYCFVKKKYLGVPQLQLHVISKHDTIEWEGMTIRPIEVMHDRLPILGYRIGSLAYITDMSSISTEELAKLAGVKTLVVNALRLEPHHSHQTLAEALHMISQLHPDVAYFVHLSHQMGKHEDVERTLPPHVHLAYDGLEIEW